MRLSTAVLLAVMSAGATTEPHTESAALLTCSDQQRSRVIAPAAQSGAIAGQVTDTVGQAVAGATVTVIPETGGVAKRTESGADGRYRIDGLAEARYRVDFEVAGFDLARRNHVAITLDGTGRADATLRVSTICECVTRIPERPLRERTGQVLSESGHPLPHARLQIDSPWREVRYADGEGRFVVRLPSDRSTPLTASSSGFRPITKQVSGTSSAPVVFRLVPDRNADVADSEQLTRACRCPGDLFTHAGR